MDMASNDKNLDLALSNAIDDMLKDYKNAMKDAVEFAAKEAGKDLMKKARTCLQEYYASREPEEYERINILQYAFLPYSKINYKDGKVTGSVGVEYDATTLELYIGDPIMYKSGDEMKVKHVGYYGSEKHQPVDASWVIDNYLKGLHPDGGDDYASFYRDQKSPNQKMDEYIKSYAKTFDENVLLGLMGQIAKKMK
jgi:hypothetical protein